MEWIEWEKARALGEALPDNPAIQEVLLEANAQALRNEIPTEPHLIPTSDGPPQPLHRWYGTIDDRIFSLECAQNDSEAESAVLIFTPFLSRQDQLGDWSILEELRVLPPSVRVLFPIHIASRTVNPSHVVFRPTGKGWNKPVYSAASLHEAEQLTRFLRNDSQVEEYVIGPPHPQGDWRLIQGEEIKLGCDSSLSGTLEFACDWSNRYAARTFVVRDVSGSCKDVFHVRDGRVINSEVS